jgi:NADH dehydrogenase
MPLIGGGKTRFQPVFVGDVADAVCAALEKREAQGRVYELGGPAIYTFRQLLEYVRDETRRRPPFVPLPFVFAQPLGLLAGWTIGLVAEPPLTGDQVTMLKRDNVVGADPAAGTIQDLGVTQLESVEAIVPTYLWRFRPYGQFQTRQTLA